ncbi:cryptochrome/photolyase family protein [Flavobacterium sp. Fl-77]|uniref:Cryptochrome/photolyase family protein n=1 Tax=Flavobacterium flavipigmentatum TaxID=2893884 RepID=A0AAJ2SHJ0_9FLAO|nr:MULTISPECIES: cryptochrome/photolyase family protein [unclassified Flavobacterium]MDX6182886.1 cryptochrome/photolyase family protein [Flavobacterium sp. Fl-33]MDX6186339.1 cryptochrome/photolyase family protein [Flavobacterium sp. Fl-77]UFH37872.1 cryptochrome/photolyase family protein [Flavobacterium sp. F-70]
MKNRNTPTLRLILGDQLNYNHSWFDTIDNTITYVMMEVRTETDYATHHIQKVVGFFAAMRQFADWLQLKNHKVLYIKINDSNNLQSFESNLNTIIKQENIAHFEYQLPDEYRLDCVLKNFSSSLSISNEVFDTEHFFSTRNELGAFFEGKKTFIMESFYRTMRKKHDIMMEGNNPITGQWNYDSDNRKKLPKDHRATTPLLFSSDVALIAEEISKTTIQTIGKIDAKNFIWPINRDQSLELLQFFIAECLPLFGSYQDAMSPGQWSLYHSRLSFSLNTKMISPLEVVNEAIRAWQHNPELIAYNQLEGFVRQIIGWREYMRGIYWLKMPEYAKLNFFNHQEKLPDWFWTGKTKMNCLKDAITQSLEYAYAHHIQRLMITGNFALLAGIDPDEVDQWYLGIYIDALDWVEITNTRGMSQFADGGIVGTKPYVSSAAYMDKMSHYCGSCFYNKAKKTGEKACPFNSLYWNFYDKHKDKLSQNPRIGMMYNVWNKMKPEDKTVLLEQADYYLKNINSL